MGHSGQYPPFLCLLIGSGGTQPRVLALPASFCTLTFLHMLDLSLFVSRLLFVPRGWMMSDACLLSHAGRVGSIHL